MTIFEEFRKEEHFSPEHLLSIGKVLGRMDSKVIIGTDADPFGEVMFNSLASGIMSAGADVINAGMITMPTLVLSSKCKGYAAMLSSEEGKRDIRIWNKDSTAFSESKVSIQEGSAEGPEVYSNEKIGTISELKDAVPNHKNAVMKVLGSADCPVVLDCSSNTASLIAPSLLIDMGCDVISVNSRISKNAKQKDTESSIREIGEIVKRDKGEIGIILNGNGTRVSLVDETGTYVDGSIVLALFAQYLKPKKIVVPVNASMIIDDVVDGEVIRVPTTPEAISEAIKENNADFGGHSSGSFTFPELTYCPDGVFSAALLSKMAGESRLRDMIDSLPVYSYNETSIKYEEDRTTVSKKIDERVSALEYEKLVTTDGWRVEMKDGWYLIRFSQKEPLIKITAEARDKMYMNCLADIAKDVVTDALK